MREFNAEFDKYIGEMDDIQVSNPKAWALGYWQTARVLTGKDMYTCVDDSLDVTALYRELDRLPQTPTVNCHHHTFALFPKILLGTFGADETLADDKRALEYFVRQYSVSIKTLLPRIVCDVVVALCSSILNDKTEKLTYKRQYCKVFRWLQGSHKKDASVAKGPYQLLCAEQLARTVKSKPKKKRENDQSWTDVEMTNRDAIELCREHGGFAAAEGYALERLTHWAAHHGEESSSVMYHRETVLLYERWGATEKVKRLGKMRDY